MHLNSLLMNISGKMPQIRSLQSASPPKFQRSIQNIRSNDQRHDCKRPMLKIQSPQLKNKRKKTGTVWNTRGAY